MCCAVQQIVLSEAVFFGKMRSVRTEVVNSDGCFGSDLSPPPSSFGVDLTRLSEPRFFSTVDFRFGR